MIDPGGLSLLDELVSLVAWESDQAKNVEDLVGQNPTLVDTKIVGK
jgi:hypothetical protein